jgi:hypothetical protein
MPELDNPRHELFAQAIAAGIPQVRAYITAGFSPHKGNACRLSQDERVRERVSELIQPKALAISKADIFARILEDIAGARAANQWATALAGDKLLGQELHGMFVEKRQIDVNVDVADTRDLIEQIRETYGEAAVQLIASEAAEVIEAEPADPNVGSDVGTAPEEPKT